MGKTELKGRQRTFNDTFNRNRWSRVKKKKKKKRTQLCAFSSVNQSHFWFYSVNRNEEDLQKLCP